MLKCNWSGDIYLSPHCDNTGEGGKNSWNKILKTFENTAKVYPHRRTNEQESIPVGCVLLACQPYHIVSHV